MNIEKHMILLIVAGILFLRSLSIICFEGTTIESDMFGIGGLIVFIIFVWYSYLDHKKWLKGLKKGILK